MLPVALDVTTAASIAIFAKQGFAARRRGEALARPRQRAPEKIAEGYGPAAARLERWLRAMFAIKYKKVCDDPEMFATHLALAQEAREVVKAHEIASSIRLRISFPTA